MNFTQETQSLIKAAMAQGYGPGSLSKALSTTTGLVNIDLSAPAKKLIPVITPLRNMLPRVKGDGGTATQWRAILNPNSSTMDPGVEQGKRNGDLSVTAKSYSAAYATIGHEQYVTFEGQSAAEGFDDMVARSAELTLWATMISEENVLIGGNNSISLGTTGNVTLTAPATLGSLSDGTYRANCVALTHDGWRKSNVLTSAGFVGITTTRTNMDATTTTVNNGFAIAGTTQTITLSGGTATQSITASVTPKQGAVAYFWFLGQTSDAATYAYAVTTISSITFTGAVQTGNYALNTNFQSDTSKNANVFDGLISLIAGAGQENPGAVASGALFADNAGAALTSDGGSNVVEILKDFKSFWDNYRLGPTHIMVGSGLKNVINKLTVGNGSAPLVRFTSDINSQHNMSAGVDVGELLNPYAVGGSKLVKVLLHPNLPDGTIIYYCEALPYPLANVSNPAEVRCRRDYYQIDWPLRTRRYEFGIYAEEVLVHHAPFSMGMRVNCSNS